MIYTKWAIDGMEIKTIEYSGHGFRMKEPLPENLEDMVDDAIRQIDTLGDYILFGHSMGAFLAYHITLKAKEKGIKMPKFVGLSACEPPSYLPRKAERFSKLATDPEATVRFMIKYNRMSEKRIRSKMFSEIFMPYIQNDYKILSEYQYLPGERLNVPAFVFCSKEDSLMRYEVMNEWKDFFFDISINEVKGDHFYIEDEDTADDIMNRMSCIKE